MSDEDWESQLENEIEKEAKETVKKELINKKKSETVIEKKLDNISSVNKNESIDNKTEIKINLVTEKDFIDLANSNTGKITSANKSSKYSLIYLKQNLDLLAPTLDADKIDQIIQDLKVLLNKKNKEKKLSTKSNKPIEKIEDIAQIDTKKEVVERNNYNDDDFM